MLAFVDLGFGITSNQTICSEDDILPENFSLDEDDLLYLGDPTDEHFDQRAADAFAASGYLYKGDNS